MKFKYEAMNALGETLTGEIEAEDTKQALSMLRSMGYFTTKIKPANEKDENKGSYLDVVKRWAGC